MVSKEQILSIIGLDTEFLDDTTEQNRLIKNIRGFVSRKGLIGEVLSIKEVEIPPKYLYDFNKCEARIKIKNKEFIKEARKELLDNELLFSTNDFIFIVNLI